ncbi:MAG: diguanylate cyclase [Streptosporangiales bacterium]|nr:diguanylate cyclase [Streptosporangiales bacterium]MBO0892606.1 diguanylate cyclase [Acidothermales bacterium]
MTRSAGGTESTLPGTVLCLVDDDVAAEAVHRELAAVGVRVRRVGDVQQLVQESARDRSTALVIDSTHDHGGGLTRVRGVRGDFKLAGLPLVVLTPPELPVSFLAALGDVADDYLPMPWAPGALWTRLAWAALRNAEFSPMAALTGLPGLMRLGQELDRWMESDETFAYCRLDLDRFEAFNQAYGYPLGDELIQTLAATLRRVAADLSPAPFVAHLGGDDFVLLCARDDARPACRDAADMFATDTLQHYADADRERGTFELTDRRGVVSQVPLVTVSVGVATDEYRTYTDRRQVAAVAGEMLAFAKKGATANIAVDRRHS